MKLALEVAQASYCQRKQVGALIVQGDNVIAIGYNGTISGFPNVCELEDGTTRPDVLHAESNAIAKCAKSSNSSDGRHCMSLCRPALNVQKLLFNLV